MGIRPKNVLVYIFRLLKANSLDRLIDRSIDVLCKIILELVIL